MRRRPHPSLQEDAEEEDYNLMNANNNNDRSHASWLSPVIWNILAVETGERFAYFGFRAILTLYFKQQLEFSESQSIAFFAFVTCAAYLSPIAGALLADGPLGRYTTILWFGFIYVVGLIILTAAAAFPTIHLQLKRALTFIGLFLVCLGTGGIKPCVSAFGADQIAVGETSTTNTPSTVSPSSESDTAASSEQQEETQQSDGIMKEDPTTVIDPREMTLEQTEHSQEDQVRAFFSYFYFCINVGAVTSIALVPIVRGHFGFGAAFLLPTCFMITAMILFVSHRHQYVHHNEKDGYSASLSTTFRLCWWLFRHNLFSSVPWVARTFPCLRPGPLSPQQQQQQRGQHTLVPSQEEENDEGQEQPNLSNNTEQEDAAAANDETLNQQLNDAAQALHVLPIMAMFPIFWCLYDQQGSVWTLQANRMALHGLQPEQLNLVNPLEIMIFIPLFERCIYPAMEAKGWNIRPLRRMAWGMVLTALAFFVSGLVESAIQRRQAVGEKVNVFWQLPQITILAVGEIFLSVTGLEFAYATSPQRLKAFLMAIYLLTTAVGDFFGGLMYSTVFGELNLALVMHICAVLMLGNLALFLKVAHWWERHEFHELRRAPSIELEGLEFQERHEIT